MGKGPRRLQDYAAFMICMLLITLLYATFSASKNDPFQSWKQQLINWTSNPSSNELNEADQAAGSHKSLLRRLVRGDEEAQLDANGFSCHSDIHTDICIANKPVRIDNRASLTAYVESNQPSVKRVVRPYARKDDGTAMKLVTPMQIVHGNTTYPACEIIHNVPAIVFSSGGFTGNIFHEFNEIIIPLFITSSHFQSYVKLVITDYKLWWVQKYHQILAHLSRYEIINPAADGRVHCFPGAVVGLVYHDNLALNITDIPGGYSMLDFKQFLGESYSLKIHHVSEIKEHVLLLISRRKTRKFLNEDQMVEMMEALGFKVIVMPPERMSNLDKFAEIVNSCSVMVGAHGAGLTNEIFLAAGAVMVQVVPIGLDWPSSNYYGGPASEMGVQYLEYKIEPEESSLIDSYSRDHPVIAQPESLFISKGYQAARAIYLDGQDVKINLERFRETLLKAKQLLDLSTPMY